MKKISLFFAAFVVAVSVYAQTPGNYSNPLTYCNHCDAYTTSYWYDVSTNMWITGGLPDVDEKFTFALEIADADLLGYLQSYSGDGIPTIGMHIWTETNDYVDLRLKHITGNIYGIDMVASQVFAAMDGGLLNNGELYFTYFAAEVGGNIWYQFVHLFNEPIRFTYEYDYMYGYYKAQTGVNTCFSILLGDDEYIGRTSLSSESGPVIGTALPVSFYTISATPSNGMGYVTGAGTYAEGKSVTLTAATYYPSYTLFVGWQENGSTVSTDATYTFNAAENRTLTAVFVENSETDLEAQIAALQSQVAALTDELSDCNNATNDLKAQISTLNAQNALLQSQIDALMVDLSCSSLEALISTLTVENAALTADLLNCNNNANNLETQVSTLTTENTALTADLSSCNDNANNLETQISTLNTQNTDLIADLSSCNDNVDNLEMQISTLNGEITTLTAEKSALQTDLENCENTGIQPAKANNTLSIYPNPASGTLVIADVPFAGVATIYDLSGRKVMTVSLQAGTNTISVAALPTGTYTVTIGNYSGKIVKE